MGVRDLDPDPDPDRTNNDTHDAQWIEVGYGCVYEISILIELTMTVVDARTIEIEHGCMGC